MNFYQKGHKIHESLHQAIVREADVTDAPQQRSWNRPASYIVHLEKNLDDQDEYIEYDIDSEDEIWLSEVIKIMITG